MEKLTRMYKMMYGSMDSLFVNRREDNSHKHPSPTSSRETSSKCRASPSAISKVSGYSSMSDLSHESSSAPLPKNRLTQMKSSTSREHKQSLSREETSSSQAGDSDSCHSDTYSVTYRTVNIISDVKYHQYQQPFGQEERPPGKPNRLTPFLSKEMSQSTQSLPTIASPNSNGQSSSKKGSFADLLARKKNQKSKTTQKTIHEESGQNLQGSVSMQQLSTPANHIKISSTKDLIEILIYQLQILERRQSQLEIQNQNLERANKIYQQKLNLATRESELLKQKAAMLESEIWRCLICSRDKVQLYSSDAVTVALVCGHLFCSECATIPRTACPKCSHPFTIDRRIHL